MVIALVAIIIVHLGVSILHRREKMPKALLPACSSHREDPRNDIVLEEMPLRPHVDIAGKES